ACVAARNEDATVAGRLWTLAEGLEHEIGFRMVAAERVRYERNLSPPLTNTDEYRAGIADAANIDPLSPAADIVNRQRRPSRQPIDNPGMTEPGRWDETLYAGSAAHYVTGRLPYPDDLGKQIVAAAGVGNRARALDVGCGPGSLTLLLAGSVGHVVGI